MRHFAFVHVIISFWQFGFTIAEGDAAVGVFVVKRQYVTTFDFEQVHAVVVVADSLRLGLGRTTRRVIEFWRV